MYKELHADYQVGTLSEFTTLYAEVIPEEERNAGEGDTAIFCFHFDKESNKPHGVPFKFVVKCVSDSPWRNARNALLTALKGGEPFKETKVRLSKRTGIKGKQFDKMKFAVVQRSMYSRPMYLSDGVSHQLPSYRDTN